MVKSENKENIKERIKERIKVNIDMFRCPVCGNKMTMDGLKSVVCLRNHCFDLSKNGYINMLLHPVKTDYDKNMFAARQNICAGGFFDRMIEAIEGCIIKEVSNKEFAEIKILDIGCGEGSHLARLVNGLQDKLSVPVQAVGIDISKGGIQIAAKKYTNIIWCVANLAQIPFFDKQFHVLLNIFSPANYAEFNRIIKEDGVLVKVVPGNNHLQELRSAFYGKTDESTYSNKRVVEIFENSFAVSEIKQIQYNVSLEGMNVEHLVKMTPLSWGVAPDKIQKILYTGMDSVTVDLVVILGKKDRTC